MSIIGEKTWPRSFGPMPYRKIGGPEGCIARRAEFVGNSMSAYWAVIDGVDTYIVVSYATVIATLTSGTTRTGNLATVEIAENRWGPTSGRHINLCRAWL